MKPTKRRKEREFWVAYWDKQPIGVFDAGEAGYALENATSAEFAAKQIYKASGYLINPCRFFDSDQAALDDMRKLAEESV